MASPVDAGDINIDELTRYLKYVLQVFKEETLTQVWTNLTVVKTNRAECEKLARVYQAGVEKIATLVPLVLQCPEAPCIVESIERIEQIERTESLLWLLLSLAEIERCMRSGGCYLLSCVEFLGSEFGNISVSRMISSLVREFSFSLDLVLVTCTIVMCKSRKQQHDALESADAWRDLAAESLGYCPPSEFFEWCESRCGPVLKQCFLDLVQELWQFCALGGETSCEDPGWVIVRRQLGNERKPDLTSVSGGLSFQRSDSLPIEIEYRDLLDQQYLGEGAYGTVFRCKWDDRDCAVKMVKLDPENLDCERAFEKEVSILASLRHPNAVQTFGFGYTENRAQGFYVMERMQTDLSTILSDKKRLSGESPVFPIDVSMDIISQIVEGMCALRLQRVLHRDLKPANILVNRPDESAHPFERFYFVKLADFGTSNVRGGSHSFFKTRTGTIAYMAPEVMSATDDSPDHRYSWEADVYSFGLVCSEILTGEPPFRNYDGHLRKTLEAVSVGERPPLPLDAGDPLKRLIEDCWKLNPQERPNVWEVRKRLWECRLFHFFLMKKLSTSLRAFSFEGLTSRGSIGRSEIEPGIVSSPGNKAVDQAAVTLSRDVSRNSYREPLQGPKLMQHVIDMARSARRCISKCPDLGLELSSIERNSKELVELSVEPQSLCLADVERLRGRITRLGDRLRALIVSLRKADVGVHHCCSTSGLLRLFSPEVSARIISLFDVTGFAGSRRGPAVVMPTREQVSAAMKQIEFDPHDVHVAVCGASGSGVSSIINAFRDQSDDDSRAPVGVTKCTSKLARYRSHYFSGGRRFMAPAYGSLWWYDVPGAGTMTTPEAHYFHAQGLYAFDVLVLVYDARFSTIDAEIVRKCVRFNIPVLIARSKADQHIANMIRVADGSQPGDGESYETKYQNMVDEFVRVTRAEFQTQMEAIAADPELDERDQELLLKKRVYIVSSKARAEPWSSASRGQTFIDENALHEDLSSLVPRLYRLARFASDLNVSNIPRIEFFVAT